MQPVQYNLNPSIGLESYVFSQAIDDDTSDPMIIDDDYEVTGPVLSQDRSGLLATPPVSKLFETIRQVCDEVDYSLS